MTASMSLNTFAGDYADVKFIGFSPDGKYLAFEESGDWDVHRGGDYATTYFVDVAKNVYAVPPSAYSFSENDDLLTGRFSQAAQMRRYKLSVATKIKRLKIVIGNTGRLVVAHLDTDRSFDKPVMKEADFVWPDGTSIRKLLPFYEGDSLLPPDYNPNKVIFNPVLNPLNPRDDKFYELELKLIPCGKSCEDACGFEVSPSMIELTLKNNTHPNESVPRILQKDKFLPKFRNCPYNYRIVQVYYYRDKLAVFIDVLTVGFPGSSKGYMVVTGEINDEEIK